jgi:phenylacetate-CoA ligase
MRIQVEMRPDTFQEDMRYLKELQGKIVHDLRNELLITPKVELIQPNTLPRSQGKAMRVEDRRAQKGNKWRDLRTDPSTDSG